MYRDQYSGQKLKAFRSDQTGRYIQIEEEKDPDWLLIVGGILSGLGFALLIFWGI